MVDFTSIPRKLLQHTLRKAIYKHLEEERLKANSQHRFMENKSYKTNLISFIDKVTTWMAEENAVDTVHIFTRNYITVVMSYGNIDHCYGNIASVGIKCDSSTTLL